MTTLIAVLVASLIGSLHCAGMCGPLVAFAVGTAETHTFRSRLALQSAYHFSRGVMYALAGAACGLVGAALDLGVSAVGLQRGAALLAGIMMVAVGIITFLRYSGVRLPEMPVPGFMRKTLMLAQRMAVGFRPLPRAATIGALTVFLPCGWLYAFGLVAAGSGSAVLGALVMVAFWVGTVPILASVGVAAQALSGTMGRRIPLATALLFVLLGLGTIAERWAISGESMASPSAAQDAGDPLESLKTIHDTTPPCCRNHDS